MAKIEVSAPRFEHHHNGIGLHTPTPRLSWSLSQSDKSCDGWEQTSYDIQISFEDGGPPEHYSVESPNSVCVPWPARPLKSCESASVCVRSFGRTQSSDTERGSIQPTQWSPTVVVETAILDTTEWKAKWIAAEKQQTNDDGSLRPIHLAKSFELPQHLVIKRARLYMTAHGCYNASINGRPIGNQCLAPGWQSYNHRLHYQVYDVGQLVSQSNTIDVQIGPGWFASALAWAGGRRCFYGKELSLLAQLMVEFEEGSELFVLGSDDTWSSLTSSVISSEIYNGEIFDMAPATHPDTSMKARFIRSPTSELVSPETPPVRITQEISPSKIFYSRSGKVLIDFGQNLVGRLRVISLKKSKGTSVSFSHAEVLEDDELGRRPLRYAKSTDTIICDGTQLVDWTPKFTFHGFRYVEVTGWSPDDVECPLTGDSLIAQVMHTDMRRTGWFECSHPLVNKLHENAIWSMRGNFLSVPTDCPQRDERLGWTGDIQVFAPSANFLYNTTGMLGNWLDDLAVEQLSPEHNGVPPFVVPDVITKAHAEDHDYWPAVPNAVWDDVAILLPWSLYQASGDPNMLRKQYNSMKAWLDRGVRRGSDGLWDPEIYQLGDWLDPHAPPSEPGNGRTDGTLVADTYLVHVTKTLSKACELLNKTEDASRYSHEYNTLLEKFQQKYFTPSGLIVGDTQTALALAINFDLLTVPSQIRTAGDRLARSVRLQQFRVATGFAGTPIILHALTATGHTDLAYRMLLEKQCPSWMYAVAMGSTTIWERWDSMLPSGQINPGEMTSFNHYALGSVVNWLHKSVGGISPLQAGWKQIDVRPVPGGGLTHANVKHDSPHGKIECAWRIENNTFKLRLDIPPNTKARVTLPIQQRNPPTTEPKDLWVGSGHHDFECEYTPDPWPPKAIMPPFWPQAQPICS